MSFGGIFFIIREFPSIGSLTDSELWQSVKYVVYRMKDIKISQLL